MTATSTEWDNEYARLARVASQLRTTGILTHADTVRSLQMGLQRLDESLTSQSASSLVTILPPHELQRRKRLVQNLQQTTTLSATAASSSAAATTQSSSGAPSHVLSAGLVPSRMSTAMRDQDDMIDQLAAGVGRLKNQSTLIGEETAMHVHLINDMETNLDLAAASLTDQTRRAATLREEQSLWRLQLVVAGLAVLLVLEILLGLTP